MEKCSVSKATLGRLPCYLQHLRAILKNNDEYVSATTIAKELSLGEVQVRKDLNSISGAGRPKIGYAVKDLIESIENALGYSNLAKAIILFNAPSNSRMLVSILSAINALISSGTSILSNCAFFLKIAILVS